MAHLKLNTKQWLQLGKKLGYIENGQIKEAFFGNLFGKKKEEKKEANIYDYKDEIEEMFREIILEYGEGDGYIRMNNGAGRSYGLDISVELSSKFGCTPQGRWHLTDVPTPRAEQNNKNTAKNIAFRIAQNLRKRHEVFSESQDLVEQIQDFIKKDIEQVAKNARLKAAAKYYTTESREGDTPSVNRDCNYSSAANFPDKYLDINMFEYN